MNSGANPGYELGIDGLVARARDLEALGFHSLWMANALGLDAALDRPEAGGAGCA